MTTSTSQIFSAAFVLLAGGLLAASMLMPRPAQAQDQPMMHHPMPRTLTVSGEGTARAMPDQAALRFGVVTEADEAEAAREQNAEATSQALNAVRALGVPEENIQVETFRLQPRYAYGDERRERELVGYEAVRMVSIEVDSLELLPTLVAEVVQQGANRLEGIQYDLADRTPARNEALQEAACAARAKAEVLAGALGAQVGQVMQVSEQNFSFPRPMFQASAMMARAESADAAPAPDAYAAGEIEVEAQVQVTFALE